jgi:hypothetical protein
MRKIVGSLLLSLFLGLTIAGGAKRPKHPSPSARPTVSPAAAMNPFGAAGATTAAESKTTETKPADPKAPAKAEPKSEPKPEIKPRFDSKLWSGVQWREIGPYRGGRAVAIEGVPGEPNVFYFGAVAGGIWKTTDAGATWKPLFDKQRTTSSIGALAVSPSDHNTI